jgi:hypothetical protein
MRPAWHWLLGTAALFGGHASQAVTWPDIDWPSEIRTELISDDMRIDGRPARLLQFDAPLDLASIQRLVQQALRQPTRTVSVAGRVVVSAPLDGSFVTVDLRPAGAKRVQGFVMQTLMSPAAREPVPDKPLPADSVLRSSMSSRDGGQTGTITLLENRHSVSANAEFFHRRFVAEGLQRSWDRPVAAQGQSGQVAEYVGRSRRARVVISDAGAWRRVMINEMEETK